MRTITDINRKWAFSKESASVPTAMPTNWCFVSLPHTWNALDGQDGGGDFYRGTCYYAKEIDTYEDIPSADRHYLEIRGANSSADVYVNGDKLAHHDGGYSTWRVDITNSLKDGKNLIVIAVDNSANDRVYPQMADFTFYGGLYRNVNIISVSDSHFDLDFFGSEGIKITPEKKGEDWTAEIEVYLTNEKASQNLKFTVYDANDNEVGTVTKPVPDTKAVIDIPNAILWNGRKNPYLYRAEVELLDSDAVLDTTGAKFGCRTFEIDPNKGFILNGESYPLRGVSRHQDRKDIGNALLPKHHEEDIDLIMELGATTIRLAHYQHDQYFYDLCDKSGLVIWAEIPYISKHMPNGRENTITQMKELIVQNYNHPSIVVWGLSNEITMNGAEDKDLIENHNILNDLCHEMDKTRLTTIAVVSMCNIDAGYLKIPDVVSYNHYFGWYGGDTSMNGPWLDNFHKVHPDIPIGMSEYGCEALDWHTSNPKQGDYTEEYQAYYHEELIKQLFTREYIWATHVWNMFDFAADARNEGGENGMNHKGLVTFDRKYKKDSFYAYKAWLSDDPFVHICGKRYVDRVEDVTRVTVYSNLPEVELFANGETLGKKTAADHFFYFDVPNKTAQTVIKAVAGDCHDDSIIRKVDKFNEKYHLKEKGAVLNWFDVTAPEGYFSINDSLSEIMSTLRGKAFVASFGAKLMKQMRKNSDNAKEGSFTFSMDSIDSGMMQMLGGFSILRLSSMMGMAGIEFTKEQLLDINDQLNKIKKKD